MIDQPPPNIPKKQHGPLYRFFLKSWQPVPTWQSTIVLFFLIGVLAIGYGVVVVITNSNIVETSKQYDTEPTCVANLGTGTCTFTINVPKKMKAPVFLYYELDNFYQNHRRYMNSRSQEQLAGQDVDASTLADDCSPAVTNAQMGKTLAVNGATLNPNDIAIPCGLIARSLFNDLFTLEDGSGTPIPIDETAIAWPSDKGKRYKNPEPYDESKQWISMEDDHFIIWMRTPGLPDFRKLWGRIEQDLEAGDYTVSVTNNYDVTGFNGKKQVVLSTAGFYGGKNSFMAISYFCVGGISIAVSIFYLVRWLQLKKKRV